MNNSRGLTLVEVLVAMLVLSTAVASILSLIAIHTSNIDALEERILARIVAENVMVDTMVGQAAGGVAVTSGTADMGGVGFTWNVVRAPSPYTGLEVVQVEVANTRTGRIAADLATLRGQP